jgi:bacteriorhodopsin
MQTPGNFNFSRKLFGIEKTPHRRFLWYSQTFIAVSIGLSFITMASTIEALYSFESEKSSSCLRFRSGL